MLTLHYTDERMKMMHLADAQALAVNLMRAHGLEEWTFTFDRAKTRCGFTRHDTRSISLSKHFAANNDAAAVRGVVLHEIAHALVGPGHGHGAEWKAMATRLGASPQRCTAAKMPEGKWEAWCACTDTEHPRRHRKPPAHIVYRCQRCRTDVTWYEDQTV